MTIVRLPFADRAQGDTGQPGQLILRQVEGFAAPLEPGAEGVQLVHASSKQAWAERGRSSGSGARAGCRC
jgi:hypothetical protein